MSEAWIVFKELDEGGPVIRGIHSTMDGAHRKARVLQAEESKLGSRQWVRARPYYPFVVEMFEVEE